MFAIVWRQRISKHISQHLQWITLQCLSGSRASMQQECKASKKQLYKIYDFEFVLLDFLSTNVGFMVLPILLPVPVPELTVTLRASANPTKEARS